MPTTPRVPSQREFLSRSRALSAAEFLVGSLIVIGHNIFRVLPNEVPILFVLGLVSARVRNGGFSALGFRRPESWTPIVLVAFAAAAFRLAVGDGVLVPIAEHFWPASETAAGLDSIQGDLGAAVQWLLIVWTFAAFGEEISYRGYLLNRAAHVGRSTTWAYIVAMILVSGLFGYGHYYKGPTGVLDSAFAGLVLGAAYLLSGRNLWTTVLAHGLIDTVAIIAEYAGWAD